jgi:hypothetical protein
MAPLALFAGTSAKPNWSGPPVPPSSGGPARPRRQDSTRGRALLGGLVTADHVPGPKARRFLEPWILGYLFHSLLARCPFARGRLQPLARIPQRIFQFGPMSLLGPCLKIGLGALRQEHQPRALEVGAGLFEGRGGVGLMFARMRTGIEAAAPFPRIGVARIAGALGNRPDVNIAVVNVPTFLSVVFGSAGG